ncbi:hypothetical protein L1987_72833 [Smallanthus sonchifolius]|uniref:Uncharacterized protein n=1 Tax=Smallanthus sonchifolius TaxID=185202 RepID=A0ACB9AXM9_9ASTR|nr:hypothetical protein L1987_72833 [Smallanthus sonchifolius]
MYFNYQCFNIALRFLANVFLKTDKLYYNIYFAKLLRGDSAGGKVGARPSVCSPSVRIWRVLVCPDLAHSASFSKCTSSLTKEKSNEIKLLGTAASPFVNRVQFVLNLKSIEYEFVNENLACKSELLLTSNPVYKKVPVLLHANNPPLPESLIIIEYLDEIYPDIHPILPSDPLALADNRFWANYIDTKFFPMFEDLRRTPGKEEKEVIKKQMIEASKLLEEAFVKFSNGKAYFSGDNVGYLDVVLGCYLGWINFTEKHNEFKIINDDNRTPKLLEWTNRIWSHEAFKDVIPGDETLMNFYKMLQIYKPPRKA